MRIITFILSFSFCFFGCALNTDFDDLGLIPKPALIERNSGETILDDDWTIKHNGSHPDLENLKNTLTQNLNSFHEIKLNDDSEKVISLIISSDDSLNTEGYVLSIFNDEINIFANSPNGIYYGIQTLNQILDSGQKSNKGITILNMKIVDEPRFKWRGMHLDVGRHFFDISFIKKYIDYIAIHKMNIFHWHLTEDQGWRVEIDSYPKLTEVSAFRDETLIGHYRDEPRKFDGKKYGGYYTKDEMKEIVEYARKRYITVVPEIEMPGHSRAVLAAYPELSCTGGPHTVAKLWGVHKEVFCAGKESTFEFLEKVLIEVSDIFPGEYIHIGGDECPKDRWKGHELDQQRMRKEGLDNENELQSYFIKRIEGILNKLGKRLIGWDEILEGGLAPGAIVQSWRGMEGGISAVDAGHEVIMSPTSHAYFDYYQSKDRLDEPLAIGGYLPLEKVYQFEPVPEEIDSDKEHLVLGGQGNLWTEYISSSDKAEYMVLPRMSAMAEVLWSPRVLLNYRSFSNRMNWQYFRYDRMGAKYKKYN
tara:strand:- start:2379 stop:3977 length:1599 start_codon:yes stop_codon:yes gene_type:complete